MIKVDKVLFRTFSGIMNLFWRNSEINIFIYVIKVDIVYPWAGCLFYFTWMKGPFEKLGLKINR